MTESRLAVMEWKGAFCGVKEASHAVVASPEEWDKLWSRIGKPAPPADFARYFAVAVFAGPRDTGGFSVAWDAPVVEKDTTVIRYRVMPPKEMALQALTQPYGVRLFPRALKNPVVEPAP